MKQELYLIGTIDFDLQGPQRLEKWLHRLKPDQVTIDMDQERVNEIENTRLLSIFPHGLENLYQRLKKSCTDLHPGTAKKMLRNIGYDYHHAATYCALPGRELILTTHQNVGKSNTFMDTSSRYSRKELEIKLAKSPPELQQEVENIYQGAWPELENESQTVAFMKSRDFSAEQTIRKCSGKVVHVGGLRHIFWDEYPNLYQRLRNLNPTRIKLNEADQL